MSRLIEERKLLMEKAENIRQGLAREAMIEHERMKNEDHVVLLGHINLMGPPSIVSLWTEGNVPKRKFWERKQTYLKRVGSLKNSIVKKFGDFCVSRGIIPQAEIQPDGAKIIFGLTKDKYQAIKDGYYNELSKKETENESGASVK